MARLEVRPNEMSTWINLTKQPCEWADYGSCQFESPETLADLSYWQMPMKVRFDDPDLLMRFLDRLDDKYCQPPEEIWMVIDERNDHVLEHPTRRRVLNYLRKADPAYIPNPSSLKPRL